jgi:chromosome segregation ATPase
MKKIIFLLTFLIAPLAAWGQDQTASSRAEGSNAGGNDKFSLQLLQLKHDLQLSKESYANLKELYTQKAAESKALSEKIAVFAKESGNLQQLIERLKQEKEGLVDNQNKLGQRVKELEAAKKLKKPSLSSEDETALKARAAQAENAQKVISVDAGRMRTQLNVLTEQLRETKEKLSAQFKAEKEAEVKALTEKIAALEKRLKEAQDFSYQLVQEKAGFQTGEKEAKARLQALDEQKVTLTQLNQGLSSRNAAGEQEYAKLSEEFAKLQLQSVEFERQKQVFNQKITVLQNEAAGLTEKVLFTENVKTHLQEQLDSMKKDKDDLLGRLAVESDQHQQEMALLKASKEQELAQKEGAIIRLYGRLEELKAAQQSATGISLQKFESLQKELAAAKELSFKLVQEKAMFENQQETQAKRISDLEKQKLMTDQERDKLAEQNTFLKNQYTSISQELNTVRDQYTGVLRTKDMVTLPRKMKEREQELTVARKDLDQKLQEYSGRLKEYEQKLKAKEDVEQQNRRMAEDFAKMKESYAMLEQKYSAAEEVVQRHELLKDQYAELPQENTTLHYNLGVLYSQNQQFDKAVKEFAKVLELKPEDGETLYNLGVIYGEHIKDKKKAISYFKRYLSVAPDDADAQRVRKYLVTWETYEQEMNDGK